MRTLLVLLAIASPAAATVEKRGEKEFAGCHRYPESKRFRWGVKGEVGVPELVASVGEISCRAILYGAQVSQRGKVTLEVPDLLSASEVFHLFHASLEILGLTVEPAGKSLKIVDAGRAREVSALALGGDPPSGEHFVTRLLRVAHASPQEIAEVAAKLRSKEGDVTVYAAGSALIVTDRASVVRRVEEMVRALDVAQQGDRLWTIAAHRQAPSELGAAVEKVLAAGKRGGPGAATAIVPVDAARQLVVVGSEVAFRRVAALAARIDPPPDDGGEGEGASRSHVIYLAHTNAEEVAATLREMGLFARIAQNAPGRGSAMPLQGEVHIGSDKASNAIVVFGGAADFLTVRDLVTKLDVPRRQVFVEATILDVSADRSRDLGVAFHGGGTAGDATLAGTSSASSLTSLVTDEKSLAAALSGAGGTFGAFGPAFQIAGMSLPSLGVVLRALEKERDVNVISRPHLLTMDNVKASLSVGQSIPFPTGSLASQAAGAGATLALSTSYSRQDVALRMELTPHLNDSDSIRLEIDGEISDVPEGQTAGSAGPITNKRTLKTAVVVGDGETVVLGGLQKDGETETVEKVPGLGDIPILGKLFQYKKRQRTKQNLLIVLTPHVIRGPDDLRRIFQRKEDERREFVERETAFRTPWSPPVDWARKRGLLEEINVVARRADEEAAAVQAAARALKKPPVEGEVQ